MVVKSKFPTVHCVYFQKHLNNSSCLVDKTQFENRTPPIYTLSLIYTFNTHTHTHTHCQVCTEINAMEDNISSLQQAIGTKTGPMQLAQTRLDIRSYRPNNELVRDPVQYSLVGEVGEIAASVEQLQARLVDSESALKGLNRNQLALEEDISVKTLSLAIDQDECMAMREKLEPLSSPDSN